MLFLGTMRNTSNVMQARHAHFLGREDRRGEGTAVQK